MDGSKAEPSISYLLELSFFHFFCRFSLFPNNFASSPARLAVCIDNLYPLFIARSAGLEVEKLCNIPIEKNGWFKS